MNLGLLESRVPILTSVTLCLLEDSPIARKRSPQTFEKRRREMEKQRKRADKFNERIERKKDNRDAKESGVDFETFHDHDPNAIGPGEGVVEPEEEEERDEG